MVCAAGDSAAPGATTSVTVTEVELFTVNEGAVTPLPVRRTADVLPRLAPVKTTVTVVPRTKLAGATEVNPGPTCAAVAWSSIAPMSNAFVLPGSGLGFPKKSVFRVGIAPAGRVVPLLGT